MSSSDRAETPRPAERARLVLITGLSGSGKSTAAKALEDAGYYCVDNLPLPLLRTFLRDPLELVGGRRRLAVVTDVRAPGFAEAMPALLSEVDRRQFEFVVVFLEASEEALLRRFSETRRSHPMGEGERPVIEGIRREKALLADLRASADLVLDTSDWSVHDVKRALYREFAERGAATGSLIVSLVTFGFKHGSPAGADLLFDVRFLPNPHFIPQLRDQTGRDAPVQDYLDAQADFVEFLERLESFLLFLLPRYRQENRSYLTIGIGCTGGKHRSVAIGERLRQKLTERGWNVRLGHRDADRGK